MNTAGVILKGAGPHAEATILPGEVLGKRTNTNGKSLAAMGAYGHS